MPQNSSPHVLFLVRDLSLAGEPHGIMQLAAYARLNDWNFSVATLQEDYTSIIKKLQPQLIAASVMSSDIKYFPKAFVEIKKQFSDIPLIAGGPHATFVPSSVNTLSVDAIVIGEGEYAFAEILRRISNGKSNFENIDNVLLKGKTCNLHPRVEDLDSLPNIERDFIYRHYDGLFGNFKLKSFFSSRGCPHRCSYCFNHAYNNLYRGKGKIVRKRSVDRIINEILEVKKKYLLEYIRFADDVFVLLADDWLDEFRRKFRREVGIPFYCLLSANTVNEDIVRSLKEAGCMSACMSIEYGNEQIRKNVLGRNISNEKIIRAFDLFNRYGINLYTNCMIGVPGTTLEDDFNTLELVIRCKPKYGGFTIIMPYPGTDFYEYARSQNALPKNMGIEELMSPTTGNKSVLTCFSEEEKVRQVKFIKLAPLTAFFPFLKRFTKFAIQHLPDNPSFDLIYWFVKNYFFSKYIVPVRFSIFDYIKLARRTFKEEMYQINKLNLTK